MVKISLLCFVIVLSTLLMKANSSGARKPKFFFVSSTTSTTILPTTTLRSVTATCLVPSVDQNPLVLCPEGQGRKRRTVILDEQLELQPSKSNRMSKDINVEPSSEEPQGAREARFFWYYMTTTLTTEAFSTTTIDTTVSIISVTAVVCTPSSFLGCGK